jgi:hypothetical protein
MRNNNLAETRPRFVKFNPCNCTTDGKGFWSSDVRTTTIRKIELDWEPTDKTSLLLRVYFTKKDWNTEKHGLIYTDGAWMKDLKANLKQQGFPVGSLYYTEQGMQGDNFVSVAVHGKKITAYWAKNMGIDYTQYKMED